MNRPLKFTFFLCVVLFSLYSELATAQDNSGNKSWSTTVQQNDPSGSVNPTRTTETHSENNGRSVDKTSVETLGPDGRYMPYSNTEKESMRIDANTVRNVERTFGTGPDGQRVLIQERREETRSLPGGEKKVVRIISNPDANGAMQVIRRELVDSKQVSPGVRDTNTTVLSADGSGGLSPSVQVHERKQQTANGTVAFSKSTELSDGAGHWNLSEVRQGTTKPDAAQGTITEENILRPDSDGKLSVVERTVSKQTAGAGESRDVTEKYSTNVPGQAGNEGLQLVQRDSTVKRTTSAGESTTRQVEAPSAGNPGDGLHVAERAIDIVRPNAAGSAEQNNTMLTFGPDGQVNTVLVDIGKTNNPTAVKVDTGTAPRQK